ncbi:MAG: 23S rRNA (adenine(2030)-N(6))-methyltransferase RlmJ [Alphaproteobacteria bacterium]|nr:23S rRNA (adenine(2030)-N(6))-methyltransferase RlmJ [Alphaproteobacteria bacterium]
MNYRHAYHAGNFADVVKHAVLAAILAHLNAKPGAWRAIDAHAGIGAYALAGPEAAKTGEWRAGIGRLARLAGLGLPPGEENSRALPAPSEEARAALAPYLGAVASANPDGILRTFPGSPAVMRHLARTQDRLTLVELHPEDFSALRARYAGDRQVKTIPLDAWDAAKAFVPPKERRGLLLLDPPFEEAGEFARLAESLKANHRRWATGIFLLWHPVKDLDAIRAYDAALKALAIPKMLRVELTVRKRTGASLDGTALTVVNPPYTLEPALEALLPFLSEALAQGPGAGHRLEWLQGETP